jgi:hypothetical protein
METSWTNGKIMPYSVMQGDVQKAEEERHCSVKLEADVKAATGALSTAGALYAPKQQKNG